MKPDIFELTIGFLAGVVVAIVARKVYARYVLRQFIKQFGSREDRS